MKKRITCIILSGGKSSRMGVNKSFLPFGDKTIIEHTIQLMKSIFDGVILITNSFEEYQHLNVPLFEDVHKQKGPLAGIHSGLSNSKTDKNFIISCDLPLMTKEVVEYIIDYILKNKKLFCNIIITYYRPSSSLARSRWRRCYICNFVCMYIL